MAKEWHHILSYLHFANSWFVFTPTAFTVCHVPRACFSASTHANTHTHTHICTDNSFHIRTLSQNQSVKPDISHSSVLVLFTFVIEVAEDRRARRQTIPLPHWTMMTDEYLQVTIKVLPHHHKSNLGDRPLHPSSRQTRTHPLPSSYKSPPQH